MCFIIHTLMYAQAETETQTVTHTHITSCDKQMGLCSVTS